MSIIHDLALHTLRARQFIYHPFTKTYAEKKEELSRERMKEEIPSEKKKEEEKECKSGAVKNKDKSAEKMRKKSDIASVMNEEILKPLEQLKLDGN